MALPSITETFDNLLTMTLALRKKELVNQIFATTPFWNEMKTVGSSPT